MSAQPQPADTLRFTSVEGDSRLDVVLARGRAGLGVEQATASAADPETIQVLETFCREIVGRPLVEAADHGAIHALHRLRNRREVAGILSVRSAGGAYLLAERLIRDIQVQAGAPIAASFWNPPVDAAWAARSPAEKLRLLEEIGRAGLAEQGLDPASLWIEPLDRELRVVVGFGPAIANRQRPVLLRMLEPRMRAATGTRLELYMSDMKDQNDIRRIQDADPGSAATAEQPVPKEATK